MKIQKVAGIQLILGQGQDVGSRGLLLDLAFPKQGYSQSLESFVSLSHVSLLCLVAHGTFVPEQAVFFQPPVAAVPLPADVAELVHQAGFLRPNRLAELAHLGCKDLDDGAGSAEHDWVNTVVVVDSFARSVSKAEAAVLALPSEGDGRGDRGEVLHLLVGRVESRAGFLGSDVPEQTNRTIRRAVC